MPTNMLRDEILRSNNVLTGGFSSGKTYDTFGVTQPIKIQFRISLSRL